MIRRRIASAAVLLLLSAWMMVPATNWSSTLPYRTYATQWRDQLVPLLTLSQGANPCVAGAYGPSGSIRQYRCAVGKDLDGLLQFNHDMKMGTNISCHVHWSPIDTDVGYVRWGLDYYWLDVNGATGGGGPLTIYAEQVSDGAAWKHQYIEFADIVAGTTLNLTVSSMLVFRFHRAAATMGGPDEYGAVAVPLAMDCHYEVDSLGSSTKTTK